MQLTGLIGQFTLLESRSLNRPALDRWAQSLLNRLQELLERSPEAWAPIGDCMNVAALIEVYRGDRVAARQICESHLRWAERLTRRLGVQEAGALAIQPWINVGRLLRLERDFPQALERFALLRDHLSGRPLHLGAIHIEPEVWRHVLAAQPTLVGILETVYLVDSLKTFFMAKDYGQALAFLQEGREAGIALHSRIFLEEGELLTLVGLERPVEAIQVTMRPDWSSQPFSKLVAAAYRAALLLGVGEAQHARTVLETIGKRLLGSKLERVEDQRVLRLLLFLGTLAADAGLPEQALGFLRMGLHATRRFDDYLLELGFLNALLSQESLEDRGELDEARAKLQAAGSSAPPPVFATLRGAIEQLCAA